MSLDQGPASMTGGLVQDIQVAQLNDSQSFTPSEKNYNIFSETYMYGTVYIIGLQALPGVGLLSVLEHVLIFYAVALLSILFWRMVLSKVH